MLLNGGIKMGMILGKAEIVQTVRVKKYEIRLYHIHISDFWKLYFLRSFIPSNYNCPLTYRTCIDELSNFDAKN